MTETIKRSIDIVRAFLPEEAGLRAHTIRVAALAGRAGQLSGLAEEEVEAAAIGALLHHFDESARWSGDAKLLAEMGFEAPPAENPLPLAVQTALDKAASSPVISELIESANLFDEQFENLPYEDLPTAETFEGTLASGVLSDSFCQAVEGFRSTSKEHLLRRLRGLLHVRLSAATWIPPAGHEALFAHSLNVAESARFLAKETRGATAEAAHLAGIFHDIGRLAYGGSAVSGDVDSWRQFGFPTVYAEFLTSGTDHAEIGAEALPAEIAAEVREAIRFHHRVELAGSRLASILHLAEDEEESLPSCARDHLAAKSLESEKLKQSNAAG